MRIRHAVTAAAAAAAVAATAYATLIEPRWLQLRRQRIRIPSLPPDLDGIRLGLISDPHLQEGRSDALLRHAVSALQHARPDLVAVTGDLAEDEWGLHAALDALAALRPPLGIYAVPGNHDHSAGIDDWHRAVAARKAITDLTNRSILVHRGDATLCVAGVDDPVDGRPRLRLPHPRHRQLTILLAHSPEQAERARRHDDAIDLVLSGHTHAGQIRIPFLDRASYVHGLRRRPWTRVYISRGLGTTRVPARFLARPEVSLLILESSPVSMHIESPQPLFGRSA